jgi:hypothetical protein
MRVRTRRERAGWQLLRAKTRPLSRLFPIALCFLAAQSLPAMGAELKADTLEGFARYVRATEARIDRQVERPAGFLYVDGLGPERRSQVTGRLRRGEIFLERLETRDAAGRKIEIPGGLVHHWIGDVFIPRVRLRRVLEFTQDYDHHQDYFSEIVRSRLLARNGQHFKIFYRLRKHKVITVTLDTEHDVRYVRLDAAHCWSRSISTRIAEVVNAGSGDEHEKPVGHDRGFLWRANSYWRFAERDGGVYIEYEAVSLTRDFPAGLGWLIGPFVAGVPKESVEKTLSNTRRVVLIRNSQ